MKYSGMLFVTWLLMLSWLVHIAPTKAQDLAGERPKVFISPDHHLAMTFYWWTEGCAN